MNPIHALLAVACSGAARLGIVLPSVLAPANAASLPKTQENAPPPSSSASRPASMPSSAPASRPASGPARFTDKEYNYTFQYPSDWKLEKPTATDRTNRTRVQVTGPRFRFSVDLTHDLPPITKEQVLKMSHRSEITLGLCRITTNNLRKRVDSIGGQDFKVTDQKTTETDSSLRWYIEAFFKSKKGNGMMSCGVHALPYGKPYIVNLTMVVPFTPFIREDANIVVNIVNSMHFIGEKPLPANTAKK